MNNPKPWDRWSSPTIGPGLLKHTATPEMQMIGVNLPELLTPEQLDERLRLIRAEDEIRELQEGYDLPVVQGSLLDGGLSSQTETPRPSDGAHEPDFDIDVAEDELHSFEQADTVEIYTGVTATEDDAYLYSDSEGLADISSADVFALFDD